MEEDPEKGARELLLKYRYYEEGMFRKNQCVDFHFSTDHPPVEPEKGGD